MLYLSLRTLSGETTQLIPHFASVLNRGQLSKKLYDDLKQHTFPRKLRKFFPLEKKYSSLDCFRSPGRSVG